MSEGEEHRDIDVGDSLVLHTVSSGSGSAIVLLHGFTGSVDTWNYFRPRLAETHRVIAVDLAGHGRSSAPAEPVRYSLERLADDLDVVFSAMQVRNATVFGYSMGGRAALRFAVKHPHRVNALILESTSPGIESEADRILRVDADHELASSIETQGIEAFVNRWETLPLWATQSSLSADTREALRLERLRNNPQGLANSLRGAGAGASPPITSQLGHLRMRTLLLAGELDSVYVEHARRMATLIPGATLAIIPNSGHAIHLEQPDAMLGAISVFLA